ncbi:hypothetical protein GCM10010994_58910 [Chelatococcus reniformis]|uniref:Uncharacterized protein n=1 Tax=Chelatococcus reniformis TaxID=1494448 RepID=A0A916XRQ3_9HYPH|nr:hypothetical protein GCM10010994_58910 [Chelatococcus reniformis]
MQAVGRGIEANVGGHRPTAQRIVKRGEVGALVNEATLIERAEECGSWAVHRGLSQGACGTRRPSDSYAEPPECGGS